MSAIVIDKIKDYMVFSGFTTRFARARSYSALAHEAFRLPEKLGMLANDLIAERLIARMTPPGGVFVDIGAHRGAIFSAVRESNPSVKVVAIEADPEKHRRLAARFRRCVIHGVAVGEAEGEARFFLRSDATGYNSLVPDAIADATVTVRVATLDAVLHDVRVDVIKIDIEGAELGAFRGSAGVFARDAPTVMFESVCLGQNALGYSPEGIWDWFAARHYGLFTPDRVAHDAPPMGRDTFLDCHVYPYRTHNYFAVHASRRASVRDKARTILGIRI